jgi:Tfp pilus assembly protein PilF
MEIGNWPRAERSLIEVTRLNSEHYAPYQVLALFYQRMGDTEKALSMYRKAASLNPLDRALAQDVKTLEQGSDDDGQKADP